MKTVVMAVEINKVIECDAVLQNANMLTMKMLTW